MTYMPSDPPRDGADRSAKIAPQSVLAAPRLPVTRWNRRYLLLGAGALAALVAAGFYIGLGGSGAQGAKAAAMPVDVTPTASPAISDRFARGYADPAVQALAPGVASLPPTGAAASGTAPTAAAQTPAAPVDPAVQQARDQALAARAANPFFSAATVGEEATAPLPAAPMAGLPAAAAGVAAPAAEVQPANGQAAKAQFLNSAHSDDDLANPLRAPQSPWEVKAGTVIPAALITALNSDLPGEVIAQVTQPVYDHVTGHTVLIAQGSRLIGQYDSQIAYGQQRALVVWTRIIMPDGRSINLGAMGGADLSGAAGVHDRVDDHWGQLARGILLSTVFSVGAASAQDAGARSSGGLVINSAGSGVSSEAQSVGEQLTAHDLNRQPTLTVRAGWPILVLVSKDMILAPYP